MKINKKVVWITGASYGIGAALAKIYSIKGVNLILSARRKNKLKKVKSEFNNSENVKILSFDTTDFKESDKMVQKAYNLFGRVDILINNAGVGQRSLLAETKFKVFGKLMDVNYLGIVSLSRSLLPFFIKQGGGQFVVVNSVMGKYSSPFRSGYAASKHALNGFFML